MDYIIALSAFAVSFLTGAFAFSSIPVYKNKYSDSKDNSEVPGIAVTFRSLFSHEGLKPLLLIILFSVVSAAVIWFTSYTGTALPVIIKQIAAVDALMAAMIIDSKTHFIPNTIVVLSLGAGALIIAAEFIFFRETALYSLVKAFAGLVFCAALFYVLSRITREGIGMGDVKLLASTGWIAGVFLTMTATVFSLILCTIYSAVLLLRKKKDKKDRIPFGPFLYFGYILMLITVNIWGEL